MLPRSALFCALAVFLYPAGAYAQSQPETETVAPAHVSHIEGAVTLERDGRPENAPLNMPLLSGDRLKTVEGRAEVLFADSSALHLDVRTTLDIQSDDLVRLIDGRLRLTIVGPARAIAYRVDSPAGSVRITQPGEYRIALLKARDETQLELAVLRGAGEIFTDEGTTPVRAGERAYASAGLVPSYAYAYNSATWDAFDRWSESRRDTRLGVSAQYLPEDVRSYSSTFDEYGDWRYQQPYGYVWYPRVAVSWRPYYYGRWASYPRYGWTWIGADGFAWPTHHYGRWGVAAGAWYWIPSSRWAPAYVSWAYAPGYVSWCPLGFDNRPVIGINIFNVGPGYYSSARAWTVLSYSHFGRNYYVHQRAVNWDRFDRTRRPHFQMAGAAPANRDIAVPRRSTGAQGAPGTVEGRNATPIRWAGSRDLPPNRGNADGNGERIGAAAGARARPSVSGEAPRYVNRGDEIIRSRTERPSAPRRPSTGTEDAPRTATGRERVPVADGSAMPRTAPEGPARRIDAAPQAVPRYPSRDYRQPTTPASERVDPRIHSPRPESPADQPRSGDSPMYRPRTTDPRADAPAYRPRAYDPVSRPPEYVRPRMGGDDPRPSPGRAPQPTAPSAGERRPPPPPRSAPAPERSAPRETAVPRQGPRPGGGGGGGTSRRGGRGGGV